MKSKFLILMLMLLSVGSAFTQAESDIQAKPEVEYQIQAIGSVNIGYIPFMVDNCQCDEWDCNYQGGSNSECRRFCIGELHFWWYEYKACAYCPDPASLCPPSQ